MSEKQTVWITGIGLLSSHGEGTEVHAAALKAGQPANVDLERFAPYPVHALAEPEWATQISRRDMRQMEPWQQIGTYAAGLALDDAGAKGDEDLCGRMDMIVAAGGGERDIEVDTTIMNEARTTNDRDAMLNERLSNDLRPTLFLAQLSNLLAGNISIVHKVTGSSRTFMGEEGAGISAIQTAHARITSGQSDIVLVGGGYNGERKDMLLLFELGHHLLRGKWEPVWNREENPGFVLGSVGAFLVLESKAHAQARGVSPYAELVNVEVAHGSRAGNALNDRLKRAGERLGMSSAGMVFSGATGALEPTISEKALLADAASSATVRGYGSLFGHSVEVQFPLGIALAALASREELSVAPFVGGESPAQPATGDIAVTTIGHHRAEGLGLVKPVS